MDGGSKSKHPTTPSSDSADTSYHTRASGELILNVVCAIAEGTELFGVFTQDQTPTRACDPAARNGDRNA
jgi:hypothetical protein